MYDIDHQVAIVDLTDIKKPHYQIPIDVDCALFSEPMVNVADYGLAFLSWHAVTDGTNAPYYKPIDGSRPDGWLRKTVAEKLTRANALLAPFDAELLILDAYRSIACQRGLWRYFYERGREMHPDFNEAQLRDYALGYVRDPRHFDPLDARTFPIHITGSSIDVVLRKRSTQAWMDMGTKFEEIVPASTTDFYERLALARTKKRVSSQRGLG